MKDLAPHIVRQRLLIEAIYQADITDKEIHEYLSDLAKSLDLRVYGEPVIHAPSGRGKRENQGYDAFIPLVDSGIALYVWTNERFMSCFLYTCKNFSIQDAVRYTKEFFETSELVFQELG